ncbi:hypothetical protein MMC17_009808 [Xylographa soralifera]|nr:hypothetical protein [Xylographa soralifera]
MLHRRITTNATHSPPSEASLHDAAAKSNRVPAPAGAAAGDSLLSNTASPPSYASLDPDPRSGFSIMNTKNSWMVFAVASGTCAAFNGVFAKLTTTELTTSIAAAIAGFLHLGEGSRVVEVAIRAIFFLLNLGFNALMWVLFTRALTLHTSTTKVSILNTSSNFLFTAVLGLLIFGESLPPLWFAGAFLLVIGNVVIGRREEDGEAKPAEPDIGAGVGEELSLMQDMDAGVGEEEVESSGPVRLDLVEDEDDPFKA